MPQFDTSIFGGELPVDGNLLGATHRLPSRHFPYQGFPICYSPIQALALQDGQLNLRHVEPGTVLRGYFSQEFNYAGTLPSPNLTVSNIDGYAEITAMGGQFTSARVFSDAGDVGVASVNRLNVPNPGPHPYMSGGANLITAGFTIQATAGGSASGVGNSFVSASRAELVYTL